MTEDGNQQVGTMSDITKQIREEAKKALESGDVSLVIGWGEGSMPFRTTPVFIDKPDDVDKLVWSPACVNNLAVYLPKVAKDKRVGIIAKPCDIRSIITLIREKQIKRENLFIIGIGCSGVVDAQNLNGQDFRVQDISALEWDGSGVKVSTATDSYALSSESCMRAACRTCTDRTPAISDVQLGEAVELESPASSPLPELPEDRRKYWAEQFSKCIRCYACRQVCPNCYCQKCFADRVEPKWTAKKATTDEAWMFHATRVMHLAGRCIGCGECERVCPVGIPVMELTREMAQSIKETYGYDAGNPDEDKPLLGQYTEADFDPADHEG